MPRTGLLVRLFVPYFIGLSGDVCQGCRTGQVFYTLLCFFGEVLVCNEAHGAVAEPSPREEEQNNGQKQQETDAFHAVVMCLG